jgi:hypothetical protein
MIDLITVVFGPELPLLKIQARSIDQYLDPSDVTSIIIVVNDQDFVTDQIDTAWWGKFQSLVQVKPYSVWQYQCRVNGWENQQLCKLLAASEAESEWSMVLDAKTWFVKPFQASNVFSQDRRACTGRSDINPHFESARQFVEKLYNICMTDVVGPGGVPFLFHTYTVHGLVHSQPDFPDFFQTHVRYPDLVSEFYLYSGWVIAQYGSLSELYAQEQRILPVNLDHSEWGQAEEILTQMCQKDTQTASIHTRAYPKLMPKHIAAWKDFLVARNLLLPGESLGID